MKKVTVRFNSTYEESCRLLHSIKKPLTLDIRISIPYSEDRANVLVSVDGFGDFGDPGYIAVNSYIPEPEKNQLLQLIETSISSGKQWDDSLEQISHGLAELIKEASRLLTIARVEYFRKPPYGYKLRPRAFIENYGSYGYSLYIQYTTEMDDRHFFVYKPLDPLDD